MSAPARSLIVPEREPQRLALAGGLCVAGFAPRLARGWALVVPAGESVARGLERALHELATRLGAPAPELELKLIGPSAALAAATQRLAELGVTPKAQASREAPTCTVFFFPDSGRLRVERDATSEAASARPAPPTRAPEPTAASSVVRRTRVLIVVD
jgi:hypothetical protein